MAEAKFLRPPHVWSTASKQLVEDTKVRRWSPDQVRSMKNGTYDWKTHAEKSV